MLYVTIKILLTSVLELVASHKELTVSEAAKRSTLFGALIASLPLTSILAMVWLYIDTGDTEKIARLSAGVFWLVLPSLVLFLSLPVLLRSGLGFYPSMGISIGLTIGAYFAMLYALGLAGIEI